MKKLFKSLVVVGVMASMLLSNVSGVFAKPLDGEVLKIIEEYGEGNQKRHITVVVPSQYASLDLIPKKDETSPYLAFEPVILDGVTYKWVYTEVTNYDDLKEFEEFESRVIEEYVLIKDEGNPYYESDETKRIDYSERYFSSRKGYTYSELNQFYGKDATKIKVCIDDTVRTFKTAFYPKRCLLNHSFNMLGSADARIPMVGIREFVDSVPYMSLVWDNGKIIVSNSKTGLTTVFNIYSNSSDLKAVMIDGSTYASLDDLLIVQFGLENFIKYDCISMHDTTDLVYYISIDGSLVDSISYIYEVYTKAGILTEFMTEKFLPQNISTSSVGSIYNNESWVPYNKEGSLTVLNILESKVDLGACIYSGDILSTFTIGETDVEYWREEMLKVTSKYSTDKEKATALAKYLNSVFFHVSYANMSYSADDAFKAGKFVGVCADVATLYSIGLSDAKVPSVIVNGKNKVNTSFGLSQGHAINGVYYDNKWYYYDITAYHGLTKDEVSNRFFADAIWGVSVDNSNVSNAEKDITMEWSRRYRTLGYSTFN